MTAMRSIVFALANFPWMVSAVSGADTNANWLGGTGVWNDGSKWSTNPLFPNNGAQTYAVTVNSGDLTLNQNVTINQVTFGQSGVPTLQGTNTLTVNSNLFFNQGLFKGTATINALGPVVVTGLTNLYGWSLNLSGDTTWSGQLGLGHGTMIDNFAGRTITLSNGAIAVGYRPPEDSGNPDAYIYALNNHGTINTNVGSGSATLGLHLNNYGTINVNSGSLVLGEGGTFSGAVNVAGGAMLDFELSSFGVYDFAAGSSLSGGGSVFFNYGTFNFTGTYNIGGTTTVGQGLVTFFTPAVSLGSALVVAQAGSIDLGASVVTVDSLQFKTGTIAGSGVIDVNGLLEWNDGKFNGSGTTNAHGGVFFNGLTGNTQLNRTLNCFGSCSVQTTALYSGTLFIGFTAALNMMPGATFNGSRLMIQGSSNFGELYGAVKNYGTLVIDDPGLNRGMSAFGTDFRNYGTIQITNSKLDVRNAGSPNPSVIQEDGSIILTNGKISDSVQIKAGSMRGNGQVLGRMINNGLLAPAGVFLIFFGSNLTLQGNSVLSYDLGGTQAGVGFGQMTNIATATLGGALEVRLINGFQSQISPAHTFTLFLAQSVTSQFANVASGGRLPTADGRGSFVVNYGGTQLILSNFLPNNFSSWASVFFTPQEMGDPAISGPAATPQGDGVSNLLKYFFDIDPSGPMNAADRAGLPTPGRINSGGSDYLTLTYRRNPNVTGISVALQVSADLQNWQSVTPDLTQNVGPDPTTGDPIVQVGVNVTGMTRRFVRLNVTQP